MGGKFRLTKEEYKTGISLMVRCCVDFLVVKDGKLLLTKRAIEPFLGMWHLPGGMIQKDESIQFATERILTSELGRKPVSMDLLGYIEYMSEDNKDFNVKTHSVALAFKAELEEGELQGSFQAKEFQFFSEPPADTIPPLKEFLEKNWDKIIK